MPPRRLEYLPAAEDDLSGLFIYTANNWGFEQAFQYSEQLVNTISLLPEFPFQGRDRSDLVPGLRSLAVAHYLVFYRVFDDMVQIRRVLHEREDIWTMLPEADEM